MSVFHTDILFDFQYGICTKFIDHDEFILLRQQIEAAIRGFSLIIKSPAGQIPCTPAFLNHSIAWQQVTDGFLKVIGCIQGNTLLLPILHDMQGKCHVPLKFQRVPIHIY